MTIHPARRYVLAIIARLASRGADGAWATGAEDRIRDSRLAPPLDGALQPTLSVFAHRDSIDQESYGGDGFSALSRVTLIGVEAIVSGSEQAEDRLAALLQDVEAALAFWSPDEDAGAAPELAQIEWGERQVGERLYVGATMIWRARLDEPRSGADRYGQWGAYADPAAILQEHDPESGALTPLLTPTDQGEIEP